MTDETFASFAIDEALDELAPEVRELWQSWLHERPERLRERDEILAALEATRLGVEGDAAFLQGEADRIAAEAAADISCGGPVAEPRLLRFAPLRPLLKLAASLALLLAVGGGGYLAGTRGAPAPAPLAADPSPGPSGGGASGAETELVGAWARYRWSLEGDESSLSLREVPGIDPL